MCYCCLLEEGKGQRVASVVIYLFGELTETGVGFFHDGADCAEVGGALAIKDIRNGASIR